MDKIKQKAKILWNNLSNNKRIVLIVVAILFFFVILYSITTLITRTGKVATTVKYAPYRAS